MAQLRRSIAEETFLRTTSFSSIKILVASALAVFLVSLFFLSHVYACLTIAFIIAYLLDPIVALLDKKGFSRTYGAPVSLFILLTGLVLTGVAIVPKIIAQGHELFLRIPTVYYSLTTALTPVSEYYLGYNMFQDVNKLFGSLGDPTTFVAPIGGFVQNVFEHTFHLVTTVLGLLIIPLMAYYLLRDFPEMYAKFLYVVPKRHHKTVSELRTRLHGVLGGFLRGQLVVSSILSIYYCTAFAILKLELALVLGLMAGFFNVVPYLGITSVMVLTFLIAFIHGASTPTFAGLAFVFAIGMAMEGSFLTPRIVGRKVGLSPLTLILALLIGGELAGLAGMLLAVPLAAIAKVFFDVLIERYRSSEAFKHV
jgi:predicted PurR-regulated permease PerM